MVTRNPRNSSFIGRACLPPKSFGRRGITHQQRDTWYHGLNSDVSISDQGPPQCLSHTHVQCVTGGQMYVHVLYIHRHTHSHRSHPLLLRAVLESSHLHSSHCLALYVFPRNSYRHPTFFTTERHQVTTDSLLPFPPLSQPVLSTKPPFPAYMVHARHISVHKLYTSFWWETLFLPC